MAVFKCKMCGGTLEINNESVATCEYCGTTQTLPKLDDDHKANLYDRANHFRRNNEFDKAMGIYENILNEDTTDAEAYWSLVLCRYGIEYVEDPATGKRIPTVNRAQFTSIFDDDNYKSALQYADDLQRVVYEKEAKNINEIQKGILAISQKEEPFDVFICYKESDNEGKRTPDSVLAQDLYYQLKQENFKVFFSRITLEDKLGSAYEPYIFAALNSAKVMVVLGTKAEYFNAVWVKNEWSRYLSLIKQGQKKMLIPAYKDMDPYDLPEEFSHLQAQDMAKLGFMQDLIRGIKKIVSGDTKPVVKEVAAGKSNNIEPLLKRIFMFLDDGDWSSANEYCEKVLDIEPENALAYLGKLMANFKVKKREDLKDLPNSFESNNNYQKAVRFADEKLREEINGCLNYINTRNEYNRCERVYASAVKTLNGARCEKDFKLAAEMFKSIGDHRNAKELYEKSVDFAERSRKDAIYNSAIVNEKSKSIALVAQAIEAFKTIPGWRDADSQLQIFTARLNKLKRNKKIKKIVTACIWGAIALAIIITILWFTVFAPMVKYNSAIKDIENGNYVVAYETLIDLGNYKDSKEKAVSIFELYKPAKIQEAEVGDYVYYGRFEQDGNLANGEEEIEWLVLEKTDTRILVVTKYAITCKQFSENSNEKWVTSDLRYWLNYEFVNSSFNETEKLYIPTVQNETDGIVTSENIFLLTTEAVEKYFKDSEELVCTATKYAINEGVEKHGFDNSCKWWIRNESDDYSIITIDYDGDIYEYGDYKYKYGIGVRPSMWIDIPQN